MQQYTNKLQQHHQQQQQYTGSQIQQKMTDGLR
jgi:hypothetical protein